MLDLLGGVCVQCGTVVDLEIDHKDPNTKEFSLSNTGKLDGPWAVLLEELTKCQLLCNPHHVEKTRIENQSRTPWNKNLDEHLHGTARTYSELNCRCEACRAAKRFYRAKLLNYTESISCDEIGIMPNC